MHYTEDRIHRVLDFDVVVRHILHIVIVIGISLVTYASYNISSGKIEAWLMLLPGIFTFIGGLVVYKASKFT